MRGACRAWSYPSGLAQMSAALRATTQPPWIGETPRVYARWRWNGTIDSTRSEEEHVRARPSTTSATPCGIRRASTGGDGPHAEYGHAHRATAEWGGGSYPRQWAASAGRACVVDRRAV